MRPYTIEGVIIKRANIGEADKVITLFTRMQGKTSLKASSIRKLTSKRAGSLELFNQVRVHVVKGRGNLDVLTEVEVLETFSGWRKQLGRINVAYQVCEVIDKLTPDNQAYPETYELLLESLFGISELGSDWQDVVKNWLKLIIEDLGYWPKGDKFTGDIYTYIESLMDRPLNSPKILPRLR